MDNQISKAEDSGASEGGKALDDLVVVGVGSSAGGLEALTELLERLPPDPAMAFVVIQHLDPRHESVLPELLSGKTGMRVVAVHEAVRLQANHIYVISPNTVLRIENGRLVPEKRPAESFKPIDSFFDSLAAQFKERAIGIVLSGTATDGTLGLKRIKEEGGVTFAQDQTAKFDSMPRSAIAAGAVDFVLSPRRIAEELVAIARRPRVESQRSRRLATAPRWIAYCNCCAEAVASISPNTNSPPLRAG